MARWLWEGSEEEIWTRISESTGIDLVDVSVQLQFRPDHVNPTADDPGWLTPDSTEKNGSLIRVARLITGAKVGGKTTKYRVWMRVDDSDEVYVLLAGFFTVR